MSEREPFTKAELASLYNALVSYGIPVDAARRAEREALLEKLYREWEKAQS